MEKIIGIIETTDNILKGLKRKIKKIKDIHLEMIKENESNPIFLICLESMHFQCKIMMLDIVNLEKKYILYKNRVYCDYTNMYKMLEKLLKEYGIENPVKDKHQDYNEIDIMIQYDNENLMKVYNNGKELIMCLKYRLEEIEKKIEKYERKEEKGLKIWRMMNEMRYERKEMEEKIKLYENNYRKNEEMSERNIERMKEEIEKKEEEMEKEIKMEDEEINQWEEGEINQWEEEGEINQWGIERIE